MEEVFSLATKFNKIGIVFDFFKKKKGSIVGTYLLYVYVCKILKI